MQDLKCNTHDPRPQVLLTPGAKTLGPGEPANPESRTPKIKDPGNKVLHENSLHLVFKMPEKEAIFVT